MSAHPEDSPKHVEQNAVKGVSVNGNFTTRDINQIGIQIVQPPPPPPPTGIPHNLPYSGAVDFVGRADELERLQQLLLNSQRVAITAITGMGGIGKTELAIQYVKQHEADYPGGICWLLARESDLAVRIVQFARRRMNLEVPQQDSRGRVLNLTEQVEWCWQHWQPPEGLALIVLDDVTSVASYRDFLPKANRFRVLMTTRLRNLDPTIKEIPLDVLSHQEALQLLRNLDEKRIQRELQTAKELCEWLGYLPLGLVLVGWYLLKKPRHWTLAKMLQRLKEQRLEDEAINHSQQQNLSTAQRSVLAAFELSWLALDPKTQLVSKLLSLFAPDIFRWQWVESASSLLNLISTEIETANQQLYDHHLIVAMEDEDVYYKIHPLIREFFKSKLVAPEQADELKKQFCRTMVNVSKQVPQSPTLKNILSVTTAVPHIVEAATTLKLNKWLIEDFGNLFVALGRFYASQGIYNRAEYWYSEYLKFSKSFGEEHIEVACSSNNLALVYYSQKRYIEAEPLFKIALELYKRLLGEMHLDTATTLNNLGLLYCEQGYLEAISLLEEALDIRKYLRGENHPDVANTLINVAKFYFSKEKYKKAEELLDKALKIKKKSLERNHLDEAIILNNLAHIYEVQGYYTKAKSTYEESLKIRTSLLGDKHLEVAQTKKNLGIVYAKQRQYKEAKLFLEQALEFFEKCLGDSHPDTVSTRTNLRNICDDSSQLFFSYFHKLKHFLYLASLLIYRDNN